MGADNPEVRRVWVFGSRASAAKLGAPLSSTTIFVASARSLLHSSGCSNAVQWLGVLSAEPVYLRNSLPKLLPSWIAPGDGRSTDCSLEGFFCARSEPHSRHLAASNRIPVPQRGHRLSSPT